MASSSSGKRPVASSLNHNTSNPSRDSKASREEIGDVDIVSDHVAEQEDDLEELAEDMSFDDIEGDSYIVQDEVDVYTNYLKLAKDMSIDEIEEVKDVTKLPLNDLLGSLRTYEVSLDFESKCKGIALKAKHSSSNITTYSEEEVIMLTQDFGKFLRRTGKTSKPQGRFKAYIRGRKNHNAKCTYTLKKNRSLNTTHSDDDKKSDTEDDEEDRDSNETLASNVVIDLGDTSMHNSHQDASDDDFVYSDEKVTYEELQDNYSLLYTK
ncbi:hypothetical protein M9H77_04513 [Catharanthus roseus]|uniref:Uncharacterized protein n=1 Tax=Catharanthus roseus TaxID=4058 RepID=A0ACC0CEC6_CATRO|nr:hypothetical protein M9H77_04513 [Catharanthus roseus]